MADLGEGEGGEGLHYFPEGSLLNTMIISITDSEKRTSDYIKDPYTVYLIETKYIDGGPPAGELDMSCNLWRRYSEFELLRNYLVATYPEIIVPPLPEKRAGVIKVATDRFDPDFIEKRRIGLENFLLRAAAHPKLAQDEMFLGFLNQEEGWKESINATQFQSKVDSRLKSFSAAMNVKKPDRQFEDMKHYAEILGSNIAALLKVRQRMSEKIFSIHKQHAGYGKMFSEWSIMENEMGDGLQKAGHYMDGLSSSVDNVVEDDETSFADPLKEYLFYADVIRTVAKKQWLRQYDLEKAEDALAAKSSQRETLDSQKKAIDTDTTPPKSGSLSFKGFSSMIFGSDSSDALESKIALLDEQIEEAEKNVETRKEELASFVEESSQDFERFKRQEVKDVKAILSAHVRTQIKLCKLGLSTWENMRETAHKL
ncbi:sorting nexin-4-like [Actinia tenebrosa]|uniref:Sorting nexin-4-like n=1 Tax=Actinia tenebrosa TaxID=6105 RepID=A0A6P8II71_ACTTE|nr:sorting nexin-4-like [Actinia tenebrosa]